MRRATFKHEFSCSVCGDLVIRRTYDPISKLERAIEKQDNICGECRDKAERTLNAPAQEETTPCAQQEAK